ncbi:unnamed protein product [Withania somnifera]
MTIHEEDFWSLQLHIVWCFLNILINRVTDSATGTLLKGTHCVSPCCQVVSGRMAYAKTSTLPKGSLIHQLLVIAICLASYQNVVALHMPYKTTQTSSTSEMYSPPKSGIFEPIEIPPAVIPHYPFPGKSLPPMYPSFPKTYDPVLTGRCPVNFSVISSITEKTASDCTRSLSMVVGNVICCPQFNSLLHIFQGFYSNHSDTLVLQKCASKGANSSISGLCSVKSSNLTGGSCPVKDIGTFEKIVNTSKLLESCSTVDSLKECCRPVCQPAISEAAFQISGIKRTLVVKNLVGGPSEIDTLNDCKGVVFSWIARKLRFDDASSAFRLLSSCKVNKAYGQEGCLLRSYPADLVFDNSTGFSFTCDLNDNIAAPWPSSSTATSLSLCAPEMSLPALPTSETLGSYCQYLSLSTLFCLFL